MNAGHMQGPGWPVVLRGIWTISPDHTLDIGDQVPVLGARASSLSAALPGHPPPGAWKWGPGPAFHGWSHLPPAGLDRVLAGVRRHAGTAGTLEEEDHGSFRRGPHGGG